MRSKPPKNQLPPRLLGLPFWRITKKALVGCLGLQGQDCEELPFEPFIIVKLASRVIHFEKLSFAQGCVAKRWVGKPNMFIVNASNHREMVIFAVFEIDNNGNLELGELLETRGKALRLKSKLWQRFCHILKAGFIVPLCPSQQAILLR